MPIVQAKQGDHISGFQKGSPVETIGTVSLPIPFPGLGFAADIDFKSQNFCVAEEDHHGVTLLGEPLLVA